MQSSRGAELRFQPGGDLVDLRGAHWSVEGSPEALALEVSDGRAWSNEYPDALSRLWSALSCPRAGDLLVSASPGTSSSTGAAPTTSAAGATARSTAAIRWAR